MAEKVEIDGWLVESPDECAHTMDDAENQWFIGSAVKEREEAGVVLWWMPVIEGKVEPARGTYTVIPTLMVPQIVSAALEAETAVPSTGWSEGE